MAIFATGIALATTAMVNITGAAGTGSGADRAACSTMANFAWWCLP